MLWPRETPDEANFEVRHILDEHLGLLDFLYIDEVDAEVEDVKLVIEAEPDNRHGSIYIALRLQILLRQVLKVVTADLQLKMLHVIMDKL